MYIVNGWPQLVNSASNTEKKNGDAFVKCGQFHSIVRKGYHHDCHPTVKVLSKGLCWRIVGMHQTVKEFKTCWWNPQRAHWFCQSDLHANESENTGACPQLTDFKNLNSTFGLAHTTWDAME